MFIVSKTYSIQVAESIRSTIISNFAKMRPWVCIHNRSNTYEVEVSNYWGSQLTPEDKTKIENFVKNIITEVKPKEEKVKKKPSKKVN